MTNALILPDDRAPGRVRDRSIAGRKGSVLTLGWKYFGDVLLLLLGRYDPSILRVIGVTHDHWLKQPRVPFATLINVQGRVMLVNFVLVLTVLIGVCGLAIDVGMLELKKVQLQNAADAAVLSAVYQYEDGDPNWKTGGMADAGLNGFTNGASGVTVVINNPPTSGSFAGNSSAVQATVTQQVATSFIASSLMLSAQAVSLLPPCMIYLLSTTADNTLNSVVSTFTATCSVYVGRNIQEDAHSSLEAASFHVTGPASGSNLNGGVQPMPTFDYTVANDPLATITQPVFASCTYTGNSDQNESRTLNPGTYCNQSIWCSNATLTLQPGLYIITGGVNWNQCQVSGTGVTLFLTSGGGSNFGQFQITGNSSVSVSAPLTASQGSIPGILIFTDRAWSGGSQDVQWSHSTYKGDGVIYSVNTGVQLSNVTMSGSNYLGFVINNLSISNSTVTAPYSNSPIGASGSVPAGLAE